MFHQLQPRIGFPWATRAVALVALVTLGASSALMQMRIVPAKRRKLFDAKGWQDRAYSLYVLGGFVAFLGCWTPFFFVSLYAIELGAGSETGIFYLLPAISAGSILGRVLPNLIAVRVGMFNVLVPCTLMTSVVALGFIGARSYSSLMVLCVLYGIVSGALVSVLPTIPVQLSPDRSVIGNRMGMAFSTISLGALAGTPIAGHLVSRYGFHAAFGFSGACAAASAVILAAARIAHKGWKVNVKA
jgi:predicted MFS family arabinose efflux permease